MESNKWGCTPEEEEAFKAQLLGELHMLEAYNLEKKKKDVRQLIDNHIPSYFILNELIRKG